MAGYNKFENFVERLLKGEHQFHAAGHTIKIYLSNATPSASGDDVKADLAGITVENGYDVADVQNDLSETGGTASVTGVDVVWTASGGTVGPFRYVALYNDTHASDALIGWWDYGSGLTLQATETFTVDFGSSIFTLA